mgnify:CR=1 FL=1
MVKFIKKIDVRTGNIVMFHPAIRLCDKPYPCIITNGMIRRYPTEDVKYLINPDIYHSKIGKILFRSAIL